MTQLVTLAAVISGQCRPEPDAGQREDPDQRPGDEWSKLLKLIQFLTREFPTENMYTEEFNEKIFLKMLLRMFPNADVKVRE